MFSISRRLVLPCTLAALLMPVSGWCQSADPADSETPEVKETIQVTATRVPEDVEAVPASVTIISGDELRARGATDLPNALALVAGVSAAPGGDGGPAGSVPEMWGLREFDAFLLVVDDVPWGGAFNPALTTLDLTDVDRIEVMRGAAPVLYGATSFVGVIHVIHRQAGSGERSARVWGGENETFGASASLPLPNAGGFQQSLTVDGENRGFTDERTGFERGHVLWRGSMPTASGSFRINFDGTVVNQDPASPHVRQGATLSPLMPLDANYNPRDAAIDENRYHLSTGYDRSLGSAAWSTTLALTRSEKDTLRGFVSSLSNTPNNARGYEQDLSTDDVYFDSHLVFHPATSLQVIAGLDHLFGRAEAVSEDFTYTVPLRGGAPDVSSIPRQQRFEMEDERNFSGLYLQTEWNPTPRWRVHVGARLNHTVEDREAGEEPLAGEDEGEEEEEEGQDSKTVTRGSGSAGVSWLAWGQDENGLWLYADWRNAYKPAALDFGPEAEAEILDTETAESVEVGVKSRLLGGRLDWDLSVFRMDFENLVVPQVINGLPALVNAGAERFEGWELEASLRMVSDLIGRVAYSYHDARFQDYVRDFDGVATQLRDKRLEMSAHDMAGAELVWFPAQGFNGSVRADYIGNRFLNKRNTALADPFTTYSAALGYRFPRWDLQLVGENLTDERDPVAESELGDGQYYRQTGRNVRLSWGVRF
ncbi:MAG: iron complex outerrane recepter protein [Acidobacteriota bacterium]|nr:iron complex outerrane recepter protein [Acidobacteriota bacterium]